MFLMYWWYVIVMFCYEVGYYFDYFCRMYYLYVVSYLINLGLGLMVGFYLMDVGVCVMEGCGWGFVLCL